MESQRTLGSKSAIMKTRMLQKLQDVIEEQGGKQRPLFAYKLGCRREAQITQHLLHNLYCRSIAFLAAAHAIAHACIAVRFSIGAHLCCQCCRRHTDILVGRGLRTANGMNTKNTKHAHLDVK
eukprot:5607265-Pleurochrysis_carterae.AAC.1